MNCDLHSNGKYTQLLYSRGIRTWPEALLYVKQIPYGRNTNREDFSLVITENKGTCSSKHAFLKTIALENSIPNVTLIIGLYQMNETNTKIGTVLTENNLEYIPEAHCYLRINEQTIDVTSSFSEFEKIADVILKEIIIEANQVTEDKITLHQNFICEWIDKQKIPFTLQEIWQIREQCIQQLSI